MAIGVIPSACRFAPDKSKARIVIESDHEKVFANAFDELSEGAAARTLAIAFATSEGMGNVRMNGNVVGPFPVNAAGKPLEELRDGDGAPLAATDPAMVPWRYRVEVPVISA